MKNFPWDDSGMATGLKFSMRQISRPLLVFKESRESRQQLKVIYDLCTCMMKLTIRKKHKQEIKQK